jgi:hypothetical protein
MSKAFLMSRNLFNSRGIIECFRGSCLSKPARYLPEDYSKFDALEQENASRGHLSGEGKWGNTSLYSGSIPDDRKLLI